MYNLLWIFSFFSFFYLSSIHSFILLFVFPGKFFPWPCKFIGNFEFNLNRHLIRISHPQWHFWKKYLLHLKNITSDTAAAPIVVVFVLFLYVFDRLWNCKMKATMWKRKNSHCHVENSLEKRWRILRPHWRWWSWYRIEFISKATSWISNEFVNKGPNEWAMCKKIEIDSQL